METLNYHEMQIMWLSALAEISLLRKFHIDIMASYLLIHFIITIAWHFHHYNIIAQSLLFVAQGQP